MTETVLKVERLKPTREWVDGIAYRVDVSADGRIRVPMGPDDQRPDADGERFFTPIHVAPEDGHISLKRPTYCGKCRRVMNGQYDAERPEWRFCPRCGAGIAHWNWSMDIIRFPKLGDDLWTDDELPDLLPDWPAGSCLPPDSEGGKPS